ncbi:hypothetical protein BDN70DRAFT_888410 [Pholiota conissans]|uniref:Secreted protein n=1 Tax=Pholiota conissans TaxID=109636 RepID=A0A9P5YKX1_9AGAR|nr:hypothetical protein BDN70DRAFT_888410 [Pholiota conissans]
MSSFTMLGFFGLAECRFANVPAQVMGHCPRFPLSHCIRAWKHCLKFIEHLAESVLYVDVVLCMGCGLGIDNTQPETLGKGSYTYSELVYLCYFILLCGFYIHPPLFT